MTQRKRSQRQPGRNVPARQGAGANATVTLTHSHTEMYASPLPSPDDLAKYEVLIPDAPERFMRKFEQQVDHRHHLERNYLDHQITLASRGQIFALVVFGSIVAAAVLLALTGHETVAIAFLISDIVGAIGLFATGRVLQSRERIQRAKILGGQQGFPER